MVAFTKNTPQVPVVLASLVLWASFAWGLPADAPAAEGEADVAPKDPWAGFRVSDAYDYAKCTRCGEKNEVRAERCSRCRCELPQPSAEMTDPDVIFVPGKGYYREGTLLEPGKSRKGLLVTGWVFTAFGLASMIGAVIGASGPDVDPEAGPIAFAIFLNGVVWTAVGAGLLIYGYVTRTEPAYAFGNGERFEPYDRAACALRSPDSEGVALKVEVTLFGF